MCNCVRVCYFFRHKKKKLNNDCYFCGADQISEISNVSLLGTRYLNILELKHGILNTIVRLQIRLDLRLVELCMIFYCPETPLHKEQSYQNF